MHFKSTPSLANVHLTGGALAQCSGCRGRTDEGARITIPHEAFMRWSSSSSRLCHCCCKFVMRLTVTFVFSSERKWEYFAWPSWYSMYLLRLLYSFSQNPPGDWNLALLIDPPSADCWRNSPLMEAALVYIHAQLLKRMNLDYHNINIDVSHLLLVSNVKVALLEVIEVTGKWLSFKLL